MILPPMVPNWRKEAGPCGPDSWAFSGSWGWGSLSVLRAAHGCPQAGHAHYDPSFRGRSPSSPDGSSASFSRPTAACVCALSLAVRRGFADCFGFVERVWNFVLNGAVMPSSADRSIKDIPVCVCSNPSLLALPFLASRPAATPLANRLFMAPAPAPRQPLPWMAMSLPVRQSVLPETSRTARSTRRAAERERRPTCRLRDAARAGSGAFAITAHRSHAASLEQHTQQHRVGPRATDLTKGRASFTISATRASRPGGLFRVHAEGETAPHSQEPQRRGQTCSTRS